MHKICLGKTDKMMATALHCKDHLKLTGRTTTIIITKIITVLLIIHMKKKRDFSVT